MDRYRWARLHPLAVHPEFVERVRAAVEERLANVSRRTFDRAGAGEVGAVVQRYVGSWIGRRPARERIMNGDQRKQAHVFLTGLEGRLRTTLKEAERRDGMPVAKQIEAISLRAREETAKRHLKSPEAAFLNTWVAPALNEQLRAGGLSESEARAALLAESYTALKSISGGPAARPVAFPFEKKMGVPAGDIYDRWAGRSGGQPFTQPYPDLAVRHESYQIVFEGKYFRSGSLKYAERQLVAAIHESLFYLGVPEISARSPRVGVQVRVPGRVRCITRRDAGGGVEGLKGYAKQVLGLRESTCRSDRRTHDHRMSYERLKNRRRAERGASPSD